MKPVDLFAYMVAFAGGLLVIGAAVGLMYLAWLFLRGLLTK